MCGLKSVRTTGVDGHGNVMKMVVGSMDFVSALPAGTYSTGEVLYESWVSPQDPSFEGTKFAAYGNLNERYRLRHGCFVYEPTQPATTPGAICMAVFNDPDVDLTTVNGTESLRACASQFGAETTQVWQAGVAQVPSLNKDLYYADPDGSDIRLTAAGKLVIVAASDIGTLSNSPGNLYFCSETEYEIPSLVDDIHPGDVFLIIDSAPVDTVGDGSVLTFSGTSEYVFTLGGEANFRKAGGFTYSGNAYTTASCLYGLAEGTYLCITESNGGTGVTVYPQCALTDQATASGVTSYTPIGGVAGGSQGLQYRVIQVPEGLGEDDSVLCWIENVSTSTGTVIRAYVILVNDVVNDLTVDPMALAPRRPRGFPRRGSKHEVRKRMEFYLRTNQGKQWTMEKQISELQQQFQKFAICGPPPHYSTLSARSPMATLTSSSGEPGTKYVSFNQLPVVRK
jgi:hypothetical protein